uniref:Uncharacterized protein n=1 Tax=Setaria viridis TaxID=4556 RepID=A0A4U6UG27_SETVI|nr:hypothetical protein SEVIR_5G127101v2 [Setaria viridis]
MRPPLPRRRRWAATTSPEPPETGRGRRAGSRLFSVARNAATCSCSQPPTETVTREASQAHSRPQQPPPANSGPRLRARRRDVIPCRDGSGSGLR